MSGAGAEVGNVDVDMGRLFRSLLRDWKRILIVALAAAGVAFLLASLATPLYRAETRILIENRESVYTRPTSATSEVDRLLLDEEAIASQVEMIGSDDVLREVARRLDLASHEEFANAGGTSMLGNLMILVGLRGDPAQASVEERVVADMRSRLTVYRVDRSRVIVVGFSSADPELAAAVPNEIADVYIEMQEEAKRLSNTDAAGWLKPEIADLRERVREAEEEVARFRAENALFVGANNTVLPNQQLSELSSELVRVRAARSSAEARAQAIRKALDSGEPMAGVPDVLNAPTVQRLRERQVQVEADIANLSTSLLANHPRIRALNSQLAETGQQLRAEIGKVLRSVENEAAGMRVRENELAAEMNVMKAAAASAGTAEVELRALEREAAAQRALLESYLTRYREAAARADRSYQPADARIFSRATRPYESYFPNVLPITAAALVGSLLVMAVFTLLSELFSGRAMRPADAAFEPVEEVAMPAFATPQDEREEAAGRDDAPAAATLPDRAELSVADAADRLVAGGATRAVFLSPEGDEASAASVMVAREIADAGLRVLFLDLTISGAPSASMLESSRYPGITNLLASEAQFAEIIRSDAYSDCHVIPLGTADAQKAMRAIDRLPIVMNSLATVYDIVVVECGATDARGIARVVGEGTEVLVSVIEPDDSAVSEVAVDLAASGYADFLRVTPVGHEAPPAPAGRVVA